MPQNEPKARAAGAKSRKSGKVKEEKTLDISGLADLQLKLFLQNAPAAVAVFDKRLRRIVATQHWFDYWGAVEQTELLGICTNTPAVWADLINRALNGERDLWDESEIERPDGSHEFCRIEVNPWEDDEGEIAGIVVSVQDFSEHRWAEDALRQALKSSETSNRQKSEFLANVSHEIRTPLNSIIGFTEILINERNLETIRRQAKLILKESDSLLSLINDLLDHAKIESGKLDLESQPFDLRAWLDEVVKSTQVLAIEKGLDFLSSFDSQLYRFRLGDPLRLRQIVLNLISNAIKFTDTGSVTVTVRTPDDPQSSDEVMFTVQDTGIGIPDDKQELIFNKFVQADGSTTRRYGGTGLGTSISRQLVELMGGEIGVRSRPTEGSTFWFRIPLKHCTDLSQLAVKSTIIMANRRIPANGPRITANILVAEDYPANQKVIAHHLRQAGHKVAIVNDGQAAVELCKEQQFDLIVMDYQMPVLDGCAAAEIIREHGYGKNREAPIIGLTASADSQTRELCERSGMNDVITKPIRRATFVQTLEGWLVASAQNLGDQTVTLSSKEQHIFTQDNVPLDFDVAISEFEGDKELVETIISDFLETIENVVPVLNSSLAEGDYDTLIVEAHRVRGGSSNLAAMPLAEAAGSLEKHCRQKNEKEAAEAMSIFIHEYQRLKNYVYQRMGNGNENAYR